MAKPFGLLDGARFDLPERGKRPRDPLLRAFLEGQGPYTTNGITIATMLRSHPDLPDPDLFVFGALGRFQGYQLGYADLLKEMRGYFTWGVLKAHTNNTAGRVRLASVDPRDPPDIVFHYFSEGSDPSGPDLAAVEAGVRHVRRIARRTPRGFMRELDPGPPIADADALRAWIAANAWGHHASCSCPMGPDSDARAVVDSRFRVRGVERLRIVDASVFPRIPGFFIVAPVYTLAAKAARLLVEGA
jgi:choline dehydrogenase